MRKDDYSRGIMMLYKQLTHVGNVTKEKFEQAFDIREKTNMYHSFVGEVDGKIACTATLLLEQKYYRDCKNVGHIEDVVVDNNFRNYGLGKMIIGFLKEEAEKENCYKLILNCEDKNIPFYNCCGFKKKDNNMSLYITKE